MGKKNHQSEKQKAVEAVLDLLRKQSPLTIKQEKFCNAACVERFWKAKGESVKKAAKQLRSSLTWRDTIGTDNLKADEFSAELSEGLAYVAGHDEESRPVMVIRMKEDHEIFHIQKPFTRFLVFTIEVAIQAMPKNAEQFVLLFDACFIRSRSSCTNLLLSTLKIMADHYPKQLYKAFIIDAPPLFSCIWKGMRPFVELSSVTTTVSSKDFVDSYDDHHIAAYTPRSSFGLHPSSVPSKVNLGSSTSSRFSFTVSHHFDSLKPWYLSLTDTSASRGGSTNPPPMGPAVISPLNARSFSFSSPVARSAPRGGAGDAAGRDAVRFLKKNFIPSTPLAQKSYNADAANVSNPRTPNPSFLPSPAAIFTSTKETFVASKAEKSREEFFFYFKFYARPYDEMVYRLMMKPPLRGLISIVPPNKIRRHQVSVSQRLDESKWVHKF
ncbi:hypothetical protein Nepgr_031101 [Nepenthes gracilis]|uniref:CRAL-TRIO domain-containing protein n=1 Tax=Nepenthes gracilis TaxID=150966 RepID=A0AAD3THU2_NEPGR|nr:hypothetical protein Nepgr_031101 [Nepenthes gracilis]